MSTQKNDEKPTLPINLVRKGTAPKLSPQAKEQLAYEIGVHAETQLPYLRITSNGSGGYFSDEWIAVEKIDQCLNGVPKDQPFSSTLLRPVFVEGKSANNAGFLAAVLRQEQLLSAVEKNIFKHALMADVNKWKKTLTEIPQSKTSKQTVKTAEQPSA